MHKLKNLSVYGKSQLKRLVSFGSFERLPTDDRFETVRNNHLRFYKLCIHLQQQLKSQPDFKSAIGSPFSLVSQPDPNIAIDDKYKKTEATLNDLLAHYVDSLNEFNVRINSYLMRLDIWRRRINDRDFALEEYENFLAVSRKAAGFVQPPDIPKADALRIKYEALSQDLMDEIQKFYNIKNQSTKNDFAKICVNGTKLINLIERAYQQLLSNNEVNLVVLSMGSGQDYMAVRFFDCVPPLDMYIVDENWVEEEPLAIKTPRGTIVPPGFLRPELVLSFWEDQERLLDKRFSNRHKNEKVRDIIRTVGIPSELRCKVK